MNEWKSLQDVSIDTLTKAQTILQATHDRAERLGFDINSYNGGLGQAEPACYIGTARLASGLKDGAPVGEDCKGWEPGVEPDMANWMDAGSSLPLTCQSWAGGGEPLKVALNLMDEIVYPLMRSDAIEGVKETYVYRTGRYVEHYGFQVAREMDEYQQQDEAIKIFRTALTAVYYQIEALKAALVEPLEELIQSEGEKVYA